MDGALDMRVGNERPHATAGQSVFIPRGTVHEFKVTSETCDMAASVQFFRT